MSKPIYSSVALTIFVLSSCATEQVVSFQSEIEPVLHKKCYQCHLPPDGKGYLRTGLNMESYDTLMNGTMFGEIIIAGDSRRSVLNKLIEGRAGEMMRMPHGNADKLTAEEIELFKLWVNQGAANN